MDPKQEHLLAQLPAEIWQKIASFLTLREWAKACGACRTTWNLQLLRVSMTESMPPVEKMYPAAGWSD